MSSTRIDGGPILLGKAKMLRDQDILDMWILDKKKITEIAFELGITSGSVSQTLADFRSIGLKIPRRVPGSGDWVKGDSVKPVTLTEVHMEKVRKAHREKAAKKK